MSTFGVNLDRIRGKVTQAQLAEKVGVTQSMISSYISGQNPQLDTAIKIAEVLGVSLDTLCGLEKERPISARQWFNYTMNLIDNPPVSLETSLVPGNDGRQNEIPLIKFDLEKRTIEFCSSYGNQDMEVFFTALFALKKSMQDKVTKRVFDGMITPLFEQYEKLFTPGSRFGGADDGE